MATMVVQFGFPTIPFGIEASAEAFASGTTKGTSGSIRHAEELSMTIAPAAATFGASSREAAAPQENKARSKPPKSASATSSTVISPSFHGSIRPADRTDAKKRTLSHGKPLSTRRARITPPTWPVAPKTPTRMARMRQVYEAAVQLECPVENLYRPLGHLGADHARDPDRRRRDHLDVDPLGRERLEHGRGHTGMGLHAGPDERDGRYLFVSDDLCPSERRRAWTRPPRRLAPTSSRGIVKEMSVVPRGRCSARSCRRSPSGRPGGGTEPLRFPACPPLPTA